MKIYEDISLYFATSTIVEWYPVFTKRAYFSVIIDSLEYCRKEKGLRIHAYVIMLNHVHLIVSMDDEIIQKAHLNLSDIFRDFKRFTSNKISKLLQEGGKNSVLNIFEKFAIKEGRNNDFKVWQDGFHPKAIYDERFGLQKLAYIHDNPVKKGYVMKPECWIYSSVGFYCGYKNIPLQIDDMFKFK